jgi:hypothetical protein
MTMFPDITIVKQHDPKLVLEQLALLVGNTDRAKEWIRRNYGSNKPTIEYRNVPLFRQSVEKAYGFTTEVVLT